MGFFNVIKNEVKAAVGYQQNFTALLEAKDISRALNYMQDRSGFAEKALLEYKVENHEVMKRQDKAVYDKKGNFLRWQKRWKIPIPYQSFINEIALVFLYGRPVKWTQSVRNMVQDGAKVFKEVGPGTVLQGLVKKIEPSAEAFSAIIS